MDFALTFLQLVVAMHIFIYYGMIFIFICSFPFMMTWLKNRVALELLAANICTKYEKHLKRYVYTDKNFVDISY